MSSGVTIEEGVNDEFTLDVDNVTKSFIIPSGDYAQKELLNTLTILLDENNTGLIASYDNDKLKLSYREFGAIPIDGFAGSARDFLFFQTDRRDEQQDMKIQMGANEHQHLTYKLIRISDQLLRINTLTLANGESAEKALNRLDTAVTEINSKTGYLGSIQNRLDHIMNGNQVAIENLLSAESRIRDADIAKEAMQQVKNSILLQSADILFAHAKAMPESLLELLKS